MGKYMPNRTDVLDALVQTDEARLALGKIRRGLMLIAKNYNSSSRELSQLVRAASLAAAATAECYHLLSYMEGQGGEVSREMPTKHLQTCETSLTLLSDEDDHVCCDLGCAWCLARPGGVATCDFHSGEVRAK